MHHNQSMKVRAGRAITSWQYQARLRDKGKPPNYYKSEARAHFETEIERAKTRIAVCKEAIRQLDEGDSA